MTRWLFAVFCLLMIFATACSSAPTPSAPTSVAPAVSGTLTSSPLEAVARQAADRPAWLSTPLINAATNATFTLADFADKTVYVELMATWCTNCRIQQGNVRTVRTQLGTDNYVFISLSVEPKDTTTGLAQYMQNFQYPWTFAVVPKTMLAALVAQFGQSVTNPTATPHFIISPAGAVSQLATGIHSATELAADLTTAAGA